ncbi:MAG TPA: ROK family protein [Motilibacteraceae bacterium]|nr:ROK family protein [Motilibacteraceae bacterium]
MERRSAATTQDEVRRHNVSTLLRHVHVSGDLSRAELTSLMGLNRSTIKALVTELGDAGLVTEQIPETRFGAGRPSHVVVPRADAAYVLAANLGVDGVSAAAVGLGGRILARKEYRLSGVGSKPALVVGRLATELRKLVGQVPDGRLVGIGVGVPGTVRRSDGFVEQAPNMEWFGVPVAALVGERLGYGVPVRVGNDGDLGALAEHVRGAGRGCDNMIYIAGEVGVGGGLIVDGRTLQGAGGYAGEIGHMLVNPDGHRCRCGSTGCLETEAGEQALLREAGEPIDGGRPAARRVLERARGGDPVAQAAVDRVATWLGRGIASLINVFNPEVVIMGGPQSRVFALAEGVVRATIEQHAMSPARQQVRVVRPGLGGDSSLLGAAELAFEPLLADPVDIWWARIG